MQIETFSQFDSYTNELRRPKLMVIAYFGTLREGNTSQEISGYVENSAWSSALDENHKNMILSLPRQRSYSDV